MRQVNKPSPLIMLLCRAGAALILFCPSRVQAQPTVTLQAQAINDYHSILFTFTQNDLPSMEGCHYNLFAADAPKYIQKLPGRSISIATFSSALPEVKIIAGPLHHLARKLRGRHSTEQNSHSIYFRVLLSCPEATNGMGDIISVKLKAFDDGRLTALKALRKEMKYHMKYYEP